MGLFDRFKKKKDTPSVSEEERLRNASKMQAGNPISTWIPISFNDLYDKIILFELETHGDLRNFWELIKIDPEKWQEPIYGNEGGGFWVVAICGERIIWYNDIEDGFNISKYKVYKDLDEYTANQSDLRTSVEHLYSFIQFPW